MAHNAGGGAVAAAAAAGEGLAAPPDERHADQLRAQRGGGRGHRLQGLRLRRGWTIYAPGTTLSGLGAFDDKITSMRIEPGNRKDTCDGLEEGEFALFENYGFTGDCVVLPANESFANASLMGIENDSISAIRNNSARKVNAHRDAGFGGGLWSVPPHSSVNLPRDTTLLIKMDDSISSVQTVDP
jgi:hypothetical protein